VKLSVALVASGVALAATGVAVAVGYGWGLVVAGVPLAAFGFLRDDGRTP
jgi:hypothetical protein